MNDIMPPNDGSLKHKLRDLSIGMRMTHVTPPDSLMPKRCHDAYSEIDRYREMAEDAINDGLRARAELDRAMASRKAEHAAFAKGTGSAPDPAWQPPRDVEVKEADALARAEAFASLHAGAQVAYNRLMKQEDVHAEYRDALRKRLPAAREQYIAALQAVQDAANAYRAINGPLRSSLWKRTDLTRAVDGVDVFDTKRDREMQDANMALQEAAGFIAGRLQNSCPDISGTWVEYPDEELAKPWPEWRVIQMADSPPYSEDGKKYRSLKEQGVI